MNTGIHEKKAFPRSGDARGIHRAQEGMSLRDYFAGQALAGFMANTSRPTTITQDDAVWCYSIADAMLAEREK